MQQKKACGLALLSAICPTLFIACRLTARWFSGSSITGTLPHHQVEGSFTAVYNTLAAVLGWRRTCFSHFCHFFRVYNWCIVSSSVLFVQATYIHNSTISSFSNSPSTLPVAITAHLHPPPPPHCARSSGLWFWVWFTKMFCFGGGSL